MIVGPVSIDGRQVLWAEYRWPRLSIVLTVGDAMIPVRIRCNRSQARKYLKKLDPWVQLKATADATAVDNLDDSEEENENARDDLGVGADAKGDYIGFIKKR